MRSCKMTTWLFVSAAIIAGVIFATTQSIAAKKEAAHSRLTHASTVNPTVNLAPTTIQTAPASKENVEPPPGYPTLNTTTVHLNGTGRFARADDRRPAPRGKWQAGALHPHFVNGTFATNGPKTLTSIISADKTSTAATSGVASTTSTLSSMSTPSSTASSTTTSPTDNAGKRQPIGQEHWYEIVAPSLFILALVLGMLAMRR